MDHARREDIEAASIVARVLSYIGTFNAKTGYDYLKKVLALTSLNIDLSDLKKAGNAVAELMDNEFNQNKAAREQLRKLEETYDANLFQDYGYNEVTVYELMQEMQNMKKDGRKPH